MIVLLARDGKVFGGIADAEEDVMIVIKPEHGTGGSLETSLEVSMVLSVETLREDMTFRLE